MWRLEAVLMLKCDGPDSDTVPVGRTSSGPAVRALADELLAEAVRDAEAWQGEDEVLAMVRQAEAARLRTILDAISLNADVEPVLRLVPSDMAAPEAEEDAAPGIGAGTATAEVGTDAAPVIETCAAAMDERRRTTRSPVVSTPEAGGTR